MKREKEYKVTDMKTIFKVFYILIKNFDASYFITNCGYDGYGYLYI